MSSELLKPVQFIRGVGPSRAEQLGRLGLTSLADILFFFPRDYEDLTKVVKLAEFRENETATAICTVEDIGHRTTASMKSMVAIVFTDGTGFLRATWFNQSFMKDKFTYGDRVIISENRGDHHCSGK